MKKVGTLLFSFFAVLIIYNMLDYFRGEPVAFLIERPALARDLAWRGVLYVHVAGGITCLVSLIALGLSRRAQLHRWFGRIYAASVAGLLCPTGFYLAFFAKGGALGQLAFFS